MKGTTFDTRVSETTSRNLRNSSVAYLCYCCICLGNLHLCLIFILTVIHIHYQTSWKTNIFRLGWFLIAPSASQYSQSPLYSGLQMGHHFDPHLRYFPTSILCQLIRSSFSARGNFPQESSQWKICTMANKNIEDNEEIVKRNLVTIALCALVLITSAHHHHHRHQRDMKQSSVNL